MFSSQRTYFENMLETCCKHVVKTHVRSCFFEFVGGLGDAKPSIFYFFEVLQMAWDHAH